ncbi:hypothetical protein [Burkholderia anthina]|uniref:hypothetical protein n=1 Tax=Burkholderia anthina TaxID=179879 RepID=UPI0037C0728D
MSDDLSRFAINQITIPGWALPEAREVLQASGNRRHCGLAAVSRSVWRRANAQASAATGEAGAVAVHERVARRQRRTAHGHGNRNEPALAYPKPDDEQADS